MTTFRNNVNIKTHGTSSKGLKLADKLVTSSADELNILDDACNSVSIEYAAGVPTDAMDITITVLDAEGDAIKAIHTLEVYISDDADGSGLTATSASGALSQLTGKILTVLTAKKHVIANTDANGVLKFVLVDSANTAGERFCVKHPVTGKVIVGDATVAGDYEGGA